MTENTLDRDTAESYARWFHALSDPNRVLIVHFLSQQQEPVPAGAIVDHLGIGQSTVSHHLKVLHEVRFVTRRRQGTNILYAVNKCCGTGLPDAASVVLGRLPAPEPADQGPERAGSNGYSRVG
ncbi:metalloregulator ArsR/SmtB family transcription factor [Streptomyces sioyaensis]|uniref:ArsR/SmtB family transcription factor n=1 Tax=Streptomyces sioyaensis TaxID=67364 RepID=UPI0033C39982